MHNFAVVSGAKEEDHNISPMFRVTFATTSYNKFWSVDSLHGTQSAKKQSRAAKPEPKEKQTSKQANKDEKTNNGPKLTGFTKPLNLSPELQAWMGVSSCSRPEIVKKFWSYIRQNNLQDPNDKRYVNADDTLIHLTGETRFQAFSFAKLVKKHIYGYVD